MSNAKEIFQYLSQILHVQVFLVKHYRNYWNSQVKM